MKTLLAQQKVLDLQIGTLKLIQRIGEPEERLAAMQALVDRERELQVVRDAIDKLKSRQPELDLAVGQH